MSFISCVLILLFVNILPIINYIANYDFMDLAVVISGALFISSLMVFILEITKNINIAHIIYLVILYFMADAKIYTMDFTGFQAKLREISYVYNYLIISLVLLIPPVLMRIYKQKYS